MRLAKNVKDFLDKTSNEISKFEYDHFSVNCFSEFDDLEIKSPIEQVLYVAIMAVMRFNYIKRSDPVTIDGKEYIRGFDVFPQEKIGKYRCDFLAIYGGVVRKGKQKYNEIIIECDSQEFHERSERERSYEKERDRFFVKKGYKVFHYTGAEILKRPFEIAAEIISHATGMKEDDLMLDSNWGEWGD